MDLRTPTTTKQPTKGHTTMQNDFYDDLKWCDSCSDYRRYLMSLDHSYCVECGGKVRLFSRGDWENFHTAMKERRPKGGRPRKTKETAAGKATAKSAAHKRTAKQPASSKPAAKSSAKKKGAESA